MLTVPASPAVLALSLRPPRILVPSGARPLQPPPPTACPSGLALDTVNPSHTMDDLVHSFDEWELGPEVGLRSMTPATAAFERPATIWPLHGVVKHLRRRSSSMEKSA